MLKINQFFKVIVIEIVLEGKTHGNQTEQRQRQLGQATSVTSVRVAKTPGTSVFTSHILKSVETLIHFQFSTEIVSDFFLQIFKIEPTKIT